MVDLSVKIKQEENSYPIIIKNEDITDLADKILSYTKDKKYLAVISFTSLTAEKRLFILLFSEKNGTANIEKIRKIAVSFAACCVKLPRIKKSSIISLAKTALNTQKGNSKNISTISVLTKVSRIAGQSFCAAWVVNLTLLILATFDTKISTGLSASIRE